jgi:hypothetical protein
MENTMLTNQDLWGMYAQGIVNAAGLPPSAATSLVLLGDAVPANFYTTATSLGTAPTAQQALAQIYVLGDKLLNHTGFYSASGDSFFSDYATYIDNLAPQGGSLSPSVQAAIIQDQAAVTKANTQYGTTLTAANAAYTQQNPLFPGKWDSFQDFINTTSWSGTVGTAQAAVDAANAQLSTDMTNAYGKNYVAIANAKGVVDQVRHDLVAKTPSTPAEMLISADSGEYVVPAYLPGSLTAFSTWADAAAVGPAHDQKPAVSFTLQQGSASYDFSKSTYFSQTAWGGGNFFFSSGGSSTSSGTNVNVNTAASNFKVEITFQAITTLAITPGAWFDSSLMYAYGNPEQLALPQGQSALIIAMMPTIKITFDAASYQSAYAASQSSSGFGVGCFFGGGSSSSSSSSQSLSQKWDKVTMTVTIAQTQVQPIILGALVTVPTSANVKPAAAIAGASIRRPAAMHLPVSNRRRLAL